MNTERPRFGLPSFEAIRRQSFWWPRHRGTPAAETGEIEEEDRDEGKRDEREEEEKDEGVKVSKVVDEEDGEKSNGTLRGVLVGAVGVGVLGGAILYLLANRKRRS